MALRWSEAIVESTRKHPFVFFDEVGRGGTAVSQCVGTAGQVRRGLELEQFGVVPI